jgi:hypothetical protein
MCVWFSHVSFLSHSPHTHQEFRANKFQGLGKNMKNLSKSFSRSVSKIVLSRSDSPSPASTPASMNLARVKSFANPDGAEGEDGDDDAGNTGCYFVIKTVRDGHNAGYECS